MFYYLLIGFEILTGAAVLFLGGWYLWEKFISPAIQLKRIKKVSSFSDNNNLTPQMAKREILNFLGEPTVQAGDTIHNIPRLNPMGDDWIGDDVIVSANYILTYRPQGAIPMEFYELWKKRAILVSGEKKILFRQVDLKPQDAIELEDERKNAIEKADGKIEDFKGYEWRIIGAFGTNMNPLPNEKKCSYFQNVSVTDNRRDETGLNSVLPKNVLNGSQYDYFDLQAINTDNSALENQQILYAFYIGGTWYCYMGRILNDIELSNMFIS